jgi:hypothetical protein
LRIREGAGIALYNEVCMSKRTGAALFFCLALLFVIVNRAAYHGYFHNDEWDNLSWTPYGTAADWIKGFVTPLFQPNNFRPTGHFYFHLAERGFHLDFPKYLAVVHAFHLFNVWLLWTVARRLGSRPFAAASACLFFGLHMALFDDFWKPAYVFDVLCGTFSLLCVVLYDRRQWLLSFVAFWLAYKAKEIAVMLPLALACYELWFGKRRWKPLVPFFLGSLSFGLQGVLLNPNKNNDYAFRFTLGALGRSAAFYAGRVFLVPYAGFAVLAAPLFTRDRRVWWGLAFFGLLLFPHLWLPEHLFSAYCYVPFTGLAIALAGIADAVPAAAITVFFLLFAPLDLRELRAQRNVTLDRDNQVRAWVAPLIALAKSGSTPDAFVYSGAPEDFYPWGMEAAVRYIFHRTQVSFHSAGEPRPAGRVAFITWDPVTRRARVALQPPIQ